MGGIFKYLSVEEYTGQLVQEPKGMYYSNIACGRPRDVSTEDGKVVMKYFLNMKEWKIFTKYCFV